MAAPTVRDLAASVVRTFVATAVGTALAWIAKNTSFVVDENTSAGLIQSFTALVIGAYYLVVRALEIKVPGFGWLLGLAKLPNYASETNTVPEVATGSVPTK